MKKPVIMIGVACLFLIVGLSGRTQQTSSDQSDVHSIPPTQESLLNILNKTDTIESLYYEVAATITMSSYGTQTATIKIWQKMPYIKEQVSMTMSGITSIVTVIHRPDGNYTYDTTKGVYMLTPNVSSFASSLQYFNSKMLKDYLNNQTMTNLQTETIDGKLATILEYTPLQAENHMTVKLWIWNEKGLPLKALMSMTMEQMTMNMSFMFKNYSFAALPDSTFSVT
jgi:outer membrane lipoprotein-sorting protein